MKEYRSKEGPYRVRLHYEVSEIDDICRDALRSEKLLPSSPEPIVIDKLLERYFRVRVIYDDLEEGILGCTVFDKSGRVTGIIISSRIEEDGTKSGERRARSTLAHEGGHGLLHPRLFIEDSTGFLFGAEHVDEPRILCRHSDIQAVSAHPRYDGRWWEWQANRAIGGLLLPKNLVKTAVAEFLDERSFGHVLREDNRKKAEQHVAEVFDVNPAVSRIRLEEMFPSSSQKGF